MHLKSRHRREGRVRARSARSGATAARPQAKISDAYKAEGEDQRAPPPRQGARRRRRGALLLRRGAEARRRSIRSSSPTTRARATKDDVKKHIGPRSLKPGCRRSARRSRKSTSEYQKIVELQPVPPPRWVIAAGSRVGQMWGKFVDEFRAAPIPKDVEGTASSRNCAALYYDELDAARTRAPRRGSEPQKQTAKPALKTLPRLLGEVPVLRRVLAQLRGVAREELQGRVPRRRRVPRRADALEQRSRRQAAAAHHSADRSGIRSTPRPATEKAEVVGAGSGRRDGRRSPNEAGAAKKQVSRDAPTRDEEA